jgi:hypothetical protein
VVVVTDLLVVADPFARDAPVIVLATALGGVAMNTGPVEIASITRATTPPAPESTSVWGSMSTQCMVSVAHLWGTCTRLVGYTFSSGE